MKRLLIPALIGIFAVSCAGSTPAPQPVIPPVVTTVDGDVRAVAKKALDILEASLDVATEAGQAYLVAFKTGSIPASADKQIRQGFIDFADKVKAANGKIRGGLRDWNELRAQLQPIVDTANSLYNVVKQLQGDSGGGWRGLVQSLLILATRAATFTPTGLESISVIGGGR